MRDLFIAELDSNTYILGQCEEINLNYVDGTGVIFEVYFRDVHVLHTHVSKGDFKGVAIHGFVNYFKDPDVQTMIYTQYKKLCLV